jgi:hypothetical protein
MHVKWLFAFLIGFFVLSSYATEDSTLTLTLINHSTQTLDFTKVTGYDAKNTAFTISPTIIMPNTITNIIGTSNGQSDLIGSLHFNTQNEKDIVFNIIDKRLYHVGQPLFAIDKRTSTLISHVTSSTFNTSGKPKTLSYVAAVVEITH